MNHTLFTSHQYTESYSSKNIRDFFNDNDDYDDDDNDEDDVDDDDDDADYYGDDDDGMVVGWFGARKVLRNI